MSDSFDCHHYLISFHVYKERIISDFREKETKAQRNYLLMVTQANDWLKNQEDLG